MPQIRCTYVVHMQLKYPLSLTGSDTSRVLTGHPASIEIASIKKGAQALGANISLVTVILAATFYSILYGVRSTPYGVVNCHSSKIRWQLEASGAERFPSESLGRNQSVHSLRSK